MCVVCVLCVCVLCVCVLCVCVCGVHEFVRAHVCVLGGVTERLELDTAVEH